LPLKGICLTGQFYSGNIWFPDYSSDNFCCKKIFNKLRNKAEDEKETSVPTPKNIALLAEIRYILKEGNEPQIIR